MFAYYWVDRGQRFIRHKQNRVSMMRNKILWAVIIVAVAVVGWVFFRGGDNLYGPVTGTTSPSVSPGAAYQPGTGGVIPGGTPVALNPQNYSELVKQYEGRRVQFDERCQMRPTDTTFKNGTVAMFDNRSPQAKTIKIGNQSYNLPAYGYRFLTMNSQNVPLSLVVGCDNVPNVGRILLQANILGQ